MGLCECMSEGGRCGRGPCDGRGRRRARGECAGGVGARELEGMRVSGGGGNVRAEGGGDDSLTCL